MEAPCSIPQRRHSAVQGRGDRIAGPGGIGAGVVQVDGVTGREDEPGGHDLTLDPEPGDCERAVRRHGDGRRPEGDSIGPPRVVVLVLRLQVARRTSGVQTEHVPDRLREFGRIVDHLERPRLALAREAVVAVADALLEMTLRCSPGTPPRSPAA